MSMIPPDFWNDWAESQRSLYTPDGYTERQVRDRRWLWLRKKTIKVPYWKPISVRLHSE